MFLIANFIVLYKFLVIRSFRLYILLQSSLISYSKILRHIYRSSNYGTNRSSCSRQRGFPFRSALRQLHHYEDRRLSASCQRRLPFRSALCQLHRYEDRRLSTSCQRRLPLRPALRELHDHVNGVKWGDASASWFDDKLNRQTGQNEITRF